MITHIHVGIEDNTQIPNGGRVTNNKIIGIESEVLKTF